MLNPTNIRQGLFLLIILFCTFSQVLAGNTLTTSEPTRDDSRSVSESGGTIFPADGNTESGCIASIAKRIPDSEYLSEDFEATSMPPSGWDLIQYNPLQTWEIDTFNPFNGDYNASCYYDTVYQDEWLVTPNMDFSTAGSDLRVEFAWMMSYYWSVDPYDNYDLILKITTDDSTWIDLWSEEFVGAFDNWTWYEQTIDLSAYIGESFVKLAFVYNGFYGAQAAIDAITVLDGAAPSGPEISVDFEFAADNDVCGGNGIINLGDSVFITVWDTIGSFDINYAYADMRPLGGSETQVFIDTFTIGADSALTLGWKIPDITIPDGVDVGADILQLSITAEDEFGVSTEESFLLPYAVDTYKPIPSFDVFLLLWDNDTDSAATIGDTVLIAANEATLDYDSIWVDMSNWGYEDRIILEYDSLYNTNLARILITKGTLEADPFSPESRVYLWTVDNACNLSVDSTSPTFAVDNIPDMPSIVSVTPSQNAQDVSIDAIISIEFSESIDPSTINGSTFSVFGSISGGHSGTTSWDAENIEMTFEPDDSFAFNEVVTVTATSDIQSNYSAPLEKGIVWQFTVEAVSGYAVFELDGSYELPEDPEEIIVSDIDRDGNADLIIFTDGDSLIFMTGNGDGSFAKQGGPSLGYYSQTIIAADFDNDNYIDLVATIGYPDQGVLLFNQGDGNFVEGATTSIPIEADLAVAADFDIDGYTDIVIADNYLDSGLVLFNNGDSTFSISNLFAVCNSPTSIATLDLDEDGYLDLAMTSGADDQVVTLINSGSGTFDIDSIYLVGNYPECLSPVDVDSDGRQDLVVIDGWAQISILHNRGGGILELTDSYSVGRGVNHIVTPDIDGDGFPDIVTSNADNGKSDEEAISRLVNNGDGTFTQIEEPEIPGFFWDICAADFDQDGDIDIVLAGDDPDSAIVIAKNQSLMTVSPTFLGIYHKYLGSPPVPDTIIIESNSPIPQPWSLEKAGPWMNVNKVLGFTPDTVEVTIDTTGLVPGVYQGLITVNSPTSDNSPRDVDVSLHVDPSVEVGDEFTPPGGSDSLPIYISHDDIAGLFIPLSYAKSDTLKASSITVDSVVVSDFYRLYGVEAIINGISEEIVLTSPVKDPPIPKPDTVSENDMMMLAMVHYTVDPLAPEQVIAIDTTTTDICPDWDSSGSCTIQYLMPDGSINVPSFQPGYIHIGDDPEDNVIGFLDTDVDTVRFVDDGTKAMEKRLGVMHTGTEQHRFNAYVTGDVFTVDIGSGQTPTDIQITCSDCPSGGMHYETLTMTSELNGSQTEVVLSLSCLNCGDVNNTGDINIDDIVFLISYIYLGGLPPDPLWISDVNCDDRINIIDISILISYLFRGGPEPCFLCN